MGFRRRAELHHLQPWSGRTHVFLGLRWGLVATPGIFTNPGEHQERVVSFPLFPTTYLQGNQSEVQHEFLYLSLLSYFPNQFQPELLRPLFKVLGISVQLRCLRGPKRLRPRPAPG